MAISYILGMGKLARMLSNHGTGKNVLKIDIDQDVSGNINFTITLDSVQLRPGSGRPDPALPGGGERLCPVPPGCDTDGNCRARAEEHLKGNAESYIVEGDRSEELLEAFTLKIIPNKS